MFFSSSLCPQRFPVQELQEIFGGDASVEAKRAACGNALRFKKKGETSAMAPKNTYLSSTPDAASEDLFTLGEAPDEYVLQLSTVGQDEQQEHNEEEVDSDETQVTPNGEFDMQSYEEEQNNLFPVLQPVQPNVDRSSSTPERDHASLTPAERICLIKRRSEKSKIEEMTNLFIDVSRENLQALLKHSNDKFTEEIALKKAFMEENRSNFKELIGVLKDVVSSYKEIISKMDQKEVRVVRRVRRKVPVKKLCENESGPSEMSPSEALNEKENVVADNEASTSSTSVVSRKFRAPRIIKKPVPFSP